LPNCARVHRYPSKHSNILLATTKKYAPSTTSCFLCAFLEPLRFARGFARACNFSSLFLVATNDGDEQLSRIYSVSISPVGFSISILLIGLRTVNQTLRADFNDFNSISPELDQRLSLSTRKLVDSNNARATVFCLVDVWYLMSQKSTDIETPWRDNVDTDVVNQQSINAKCRAEIWQFLLTFLAKLA